MGRFILFIFCGGAMIATGIIWVGQRVAAQLNPDSGYQITATARGMALTYHSTGKLCLENRSDGVQGVFLMRHPDTLPVLFRGEVMGIAQQQLMRWRLPPGGAFCVPFKEKLTSGEIHYMILPGFSEMWWGVIRLPLTIEK